ncbi:hypothetical protein JOM56_002021 [Amanita muscaria]
MASPVTMHTQYLPPKDAGSPALAVQVIQLVDSYMIWVGATDTTAENVEKAMGHGRLCKDWACALPSKKDGSVVGTSLFRSARSDSSLSMAQRLARRLEKTVYVSVDIEEWQIKEAEMGIIGVVDRVGIQSE